MYLFIHLCVRSSQALLASWQFRKYGYSDNFSIHEISAEHRPTWEVEVYVCPSHPLRGSAGNARVDRLPWTVAKHCTR
jgi:hypothetical protein